MGNAEGFVPLPNHHAAITCGNDGGMCRGLDFITRLHQTPGRKAVIEGSREGWQWSGGQARVWGLWRPVWRIRTPTTLRTSGRALEARLDLQAGEGGTRDLGRILRETFDQRFQSVALAVYSFISLLHHQ